MTKTMSLALTLAGLMASASVMAPAAAQPYDSYDSGAYDSGPYDSGPNDANGPDYDNNSDDIGNYDSNAYDGNAPTNSGAPQDLQGGGTYDYNDAQAQYQRDLEQYERDRAEYERRYGAGGGNAAGNPQPAPPRYAGGYDDRYYADCRRQRARNQTGGLIFGGLLGAGIGNVISRGPQRGAGTAVGAVIGGLLGSAIGRNNLNCDDRAYIDRTYYNGFERGYPGAYYRWRNTRTGNYGTFRVESYYTDRYGARCSNYSQSIYINGHPEEATGHACRQPDGRWVIID